MNFAGHFYLSARNLENFIYICRGYGSRRT